MIEVLLVAGLIAGSIAAGILAEPRLADGGRPIASALSKVILWGFIPVIYFFVVARLHLTVGVGAGALLGYLELTIVGLVAWVVCRRVLHLSQPQTGAVLLCVILANTGYLGLPLVTALLGSDQLGFAVAYDSAVSAPMFLIVAMTIGAVMGTHDSGSRRDVIVSLVRNPPLIAVIAGLLAPNALAPDLLLDVAHACVYAIIPLGFFIVGLALGAESEDGALTFPPALSAPVLLALGLRLIAAPLLMIGLSALIIDVPDAYLLQAAMPCGANAVVVAHLYGLDLKIASSAVAWSTMIVLVTAVVVAPFLL